MLHEAWTGKKPNILYFREFGCDVWILIKGDCDKLSPKSQKFIFTGWQEGPKAVCYYNAQNRKIQISRNYKFNENQPLYSPINLETNEQEEISETDNETTGTTPKKDTNNATQSLLLLGEQGQSQTQLPTWCTNRITQDHNY